MRRVIRDLGLPASAAAAAALVAVAWLVPALARAGCDSVTRTSAFVRDGFSRAGAINCFESTGNPTGDNADLTTDVFVALGGGAVNVTKDSPRCDGGRNAGQPCNFNDGCPDGADCTEPSAKGCVADGKGRVVYFLYTGNPTGGNADLGLELFAYDTKKKALSQLTNQGRFCGNDTSKTCSKRADCIANGQAGNCNPVGMSDLQVSPNGKLVTFVSSGDLGSNASHASTVYLLTRGKRGGTTAIGGGGGTRFCSDDTANARKPCTKDADCGAACGNGKAEAGEDCGEPGRSCSGANQFCQNCTCKTPQCGNGFRESGETCDGLDGCALGSCAADCKKCETCGNGVIEFNENCDPKATPDTGCPPGQTCNAQCQCS